MASPVFFRSIFCLRLRLRLRSLKEDPAEDNPYKYERKNRGYAYKVDKIKVQNCVWEAPRAFSAMLFLRMARPSPSFYALSHDEYHDLKMREET